MQVYIERCEWKNLDSYVIKNAHIDCDKDTYDFLNESIGKPLNDEMKIVMNEDMIFLNCGMKINKRTVKCFKSEDRNESSFRYIKKYEHVFQYLDTLHIVLRLLVEDLSYLVVGVIGVIYFQRSGQTSLVLKEYYR